MKKTMKTSRLMFGVVVLAGSLGLTLAPKASAQVSAVDFDAVEGWGRRRGEQVKTLTQSSIRVKQMHEKDQQKIKELEAKVDQTQQTAADAEQKSTLAAQA